MTRETALLTFGIGPVHTFIAQARRIADVWAGSVLLSHLVRQAISVVHRDPDCQMIFPYLSKAEHIPDGLPNRFVCRVPLDRVPAIAAEMQAAVEKGWKVAARFAIHQLPELPAELAQQPSVLKSPLDFSWSWVSEREGYNRAALEGARQFAASRLFRPFPPQEEEGEKCAICGERTALPDGDRRRVAAFWRQSQQTAETAEGGSRRAPLLRFEQTRLCRVCATKRFFPLSNPLSEPGGRPVGEKPPHAKFLAYDRFQPSDRVRYFAFVMMDGDRMGNILSLTPDRLIDGHLETFHREVSQALNGFAGGLRLRRSANLSLRGFRPVGARPQLLYAGGDDVLLVCDPRDALDIVIRLRERYVRAFDKVRERLRHSADRAAFTISAAVLIAHSAHPAGLLFHDLEELLDETAKDRAGRNAVAVRLAKRSGPPVEVAFRFADDQAPAGGWISAFNDLIRTVREGTLTSGQTFNLRLEERTLAAVFGQDAARWQSWLAERLSRHEPVTGQAATLAEQVTPFFVHNHTAALRIARFLGREAER